MSNPIRSLDQVVADLDTRVRPGPPSKNRPLQKYASVADVVGLSSDSVTVTQLTPPFQWGAAATTAQTFIWNRAEWR